MGVWFTERLFGHERSRFMCFFLAKAEPWFTSQNLHSWFNISLTGLYIYYSNIFSLWEVGVAHTQPAPASPPFCPMVEGLLIFWSQVRDSSFWMCPEEDDWPLLNSIQNKLKLKCYLISTIFLRTSWRQLLLGYQFSIFCCRKL